MEPIGSLLRLVPALPGRTPPAEPRRPAPIDGEVRALWLAVHGLDGTGAGHQLPGGTAPTIAEPAHRLHG